MKVFISGASGLVGGNCLKVMQDLKWEAKGSHLSFPTSQTVYYNTLALEDPQNFDLIHFNPNAIVHCGALTHVDYCEKNPEESYEKTVQSTINLVNIANQTNATLVFLSTDYVFDGKTGPYTEEAICNPINIYGKHKLDAEQYIQNHCKDYLIIRVTNVYGDEIRNKNFIARIIEQCKNNQELSLKLPLDQYATPTNAQDIAKAISILLKDNKKGIYHIGSHEYVNRVTLALKVLQHYPTATYHLEPIDTSTLQQPALRPLLGGLISKRFLSEYPTFIFSNVDEYMNVNK